MTKREKAEYIVKNGNCRGVSCFMPGEACPCYQDNISCENKVEVCEQWLKDNTEKKESGDVVFMESVNGITEIKDNDMIEKLNYLMYQAGYKTTSFMYHITDGSIDIKIIGEKK